MVLRRWTKVFLPVVLFAWLAGACALQNAPEGQIRLKPCQVAGIAGQCGKLAVYEDRQAQQGRMIDLNVVVVPAKNKPAQADPLFYLAGGPGGGATQFIGTATSQFAEINQTRDLVYVDQRGTGQSNAMICPEPKAGEAPEVAFAKCLADLNGDPRFYTTSLSMDDLDDVRQALGYEKINLYGMSYGVTAAQVYLNRHPEHVRSVILDHGALLQYSFFEHWAQNSQTALEMAFTRCQADAKCGADYPDFSREFEALYQKLSQPVPSGYLDPDTLKQIVFNRASFGATIHYLLMDANTAAKLPALVHQAAGGDWSGLAKEYISSSQAGSTQLRRMVMTLEIACYEPWWGRSEEAIDQLSQGSYYQEALLADQAWLGTLCPLLPDPGASAQHGPSLPSKVPILILVGEIDPQDNLPGWAGYQDLWPNSQLVVQPGVSHNFIPSPEWNTRMADFVRNAGE